MVFIGKSIYKWAMFMATVRYMTRGYLELDGLWVPPGWIWENLGKTQGTRLLDNRCASWDHLMRKHAVGSKP